MAKQAVDAIVHGGVIPAIGLDPRLDAAATAGRPTALAIAGGRITAVGDESLLELVGPQTELVNAQGGAILPGLNDAHLHFCATSMIEHAHLPLSAAASWEHVAGLLRHAEPDASGWIRAHGWDEVTLGSPGQALRRLREDTPLVAFDASGHQVLLNDAGLRALGLDTEQQPVDGGVIRTGEDGLPSGLFIDGAVALVSSRLPEFPAETLRAGLLAGQRRLHSWGITSLTEPGLGPGGASLMAASCSTASLQALAALARAGELSLRITCLLLFGGTGGESEQSVAAGLASELPGLAAGIDPLQLRIGGVKVFADGIPRSGTSWMSQEYQLPCGHGHGHMVLRGDNDEQRLDQLQRILAAVDAAGLQAGIHSTGDATTAAVIDALSALPARDARHYVIHGAFTGLDELQRMERAGIGYSTNPAIRAVAGTLKRRVLGAERFAAHQPLAAAAQASIATTIASDSPVTSADWRHSVIAAVTRNTSAGPGGDDPQRISLAQALSMMTATAARQDHAEQHKGSIQPGLLADLCILERPLDPDIHELAGNRTTRTLVGGRTVYQR